uniref:Zinc finger protein 638 n=1 Tax=Coturnix japonica TaxID=93934 RepID=A0A8C2T2Q5_COTJA
MGASLCKPALQPAATSHPTDCYFSVLLCGTFGVSSRPSTVPPRGALPQRPRGPNPSAAKPPGSFHGATAPQRAPAPGAPRGAAPRASGQDSAPWSGSQRINVRVTLHRADPRQAKAKSNLHQEQKGDVRGGRWDGNPCPPPPVVAQKPPARLPEQKAGAQNRYTPESASSILASFGLSNEDLEELSRYPDEQLTPENMPLILREIRLRKMGHPMPGPHPQSRGEAVSGPSGAAVKGKVIDYGHASKYGYTEDPLELRARPYNHEAPSAEKREEFQREQSVPMGVPPAGAPCGPAFPPQDVMKPPPAFQSDPANPHPYFPAEPAGKAGGLCAAPVGKAGPPPAVLPVMPPILPLSVPPMAQPVVPQLIPQPVVPILPQPPFSAELLAILEQRDRIQHEAGSGRPSAPSSGMGQKPFQPQHEGPIKSPFGVVKASWLPSFLQADSQKIKRLPTPSMMNDYYATSPRIFPHLCSLCNVECARMKGPLQPNPCSVSTTEFPVLTHHHPLFHSNAADRKENQTPKHRSNSASPGPRRPRPSYSSSGPRHSRSRSRSPGRYRPSRPRSRSPRPARRSSPRHWSRSPQRSRNPLRGSPRPQRSSSNDWAARRGTRSQGTWGHQWVGWVDHGVPRYMGTSVGWLQSRSHPILLQHPWFVLISALPFNLQLLREELLNCGTVLQISNLPSDGFSEQDIKKIVQPFGKVSDLILLRSRNKAYLEMNYKEAVMAAVKYGETVPVLVNGKQVKNHCHREAQSRNQPGEGGDGGLTLYPFPLQDADDVCVVLVSNLPDKGHSVEEVSNLAKPFGGLRDVLIVSSHKQAYLEINRRSAESMVKFYSCFPMTLDGNQLGISLAPQHSTLRDEEAIFTSIIKDSDPKVNPTTLQQHFVHLGNLPSGGYRDLEVVCVGLRFGKVEHYVVLKNRNKAILQLESPKAARSMFCFLNQYSYTMGEHTLTCALSPGRQQVDVSFISSLLPHCDELPEVKMEPSEPHLDGAGRDEPHWDGAQQDPAAGHAEPSSSKAGAEPSTAPSGLNGAELPAAKAEEKLLHPCMDKELVDGLDYLQPKAGFFCQICSLFYSDEPSVKNHCRTAMEWKTTNNTKNRVNPLKKQRGGI